MDHLEDPPDSFRRFPDKSEPLAGPIRLEVVGGPGEARCEPFLLFRCVSQRLRQEVTDRPALEPGFRSAGQREEPFLVQFRPVNLDGTDEPGFPAEGFLHGREHIPF